MSPYCSTTKALKTLLLMVAAGAADSTRMALADQVYDTDFMIETPDTPRLRLQLTGTPYLWDLMANETSFRVFDATASVNKLTLAVNAVATMVVSNSGFNSIGGSPSDASLDINKGAETGAEVLSQFDVSDGSGTLKVQNATTTAGLFIPKILGTQQTANAGLIMEGLVTNDTGVNPALVYNASLSAGGSVVTRPLVVYRNNNVAKVTIAANGDMFATSFNPSSSRKLKRNIVKLDGAAALKAVRDLTPVEFVYKDDVTARHRIGFIAEDVPALVASDDRMSVPLMDTVAVVSLAVKDQLQVVEDQAVAIRNRSQTMQAISRSENKVTESIDALKTSVHQEREHIQKQMTSLAELRRRLELLERANMN